MKVRVYTACFGGRDAPHPQREQEGVDVEWWYFTDDRDVPIPRPWGRALVAPAHEHPNLAAKWWKTHPPIGDCDAAIWIDASYRVTSPTFVVEAIDALKGAPLAAWKHPRRTTVRDEVEASLGSEGQGGRYAALPLREQYAAYLADGFADDVGLWACGTIVWTTAARPIGAAWYAECEKWGFQDQISFPYVCWKAGVTPAVFPVGQITGRERRTGALTNRWGEFHPHRPGTD